jgi:RNA polymerase sigma factor for flagellar operon FliA
LGLIDAVDKFDRNKCDNFKRYAEIRIKGAILDELRAMDHVSRTVRRQSNALNRAVTEAQAELGRQATAEELADRLGTDMRGYHSLVDKLKPILVMGFDELASGDDAWDLMVFLADPHAIDPSEVLQVKKLRKIASDHIDALKDRHRTVIRLYHYDSMNLKEIGKVLGVTESRVSQLLSEALQTLRRRIKVAMSRDRVRAAQFG